MANVLRETVRGVQTVKTEDELMKTRRLLFLYGEVSADTCHQLVKELMVLEAESHDEITLFINSPGGSVTDGFVIYDAIRMMKSKVTTVACGTCASMGSVILQAGDRRMAYPSSRILIHDPSFAGGTNLCGKKPMELEEELNKLKKTQKQITRVFSERTKKTTDELVPYLAKDSWFSVDEALAFHLIDEVAKDIFAGRGE